MFNNGWYKQAKIIKSPNFSNRKNINDISLVVIHCISLPERDYNNNNVEDFFQNKLNISKHNTFKSIKNVKVSAHFYIKRNGEIIQFVSINDKAWHAGISNFNGKTNCNEFSIGIEMQGSDKDIYTDNQYISLNKLLFDIKINYSTLTDITSHQNIAPSRKTDPGHFFYWEKIKF